MDNFRTNYDELHKDLGPFLALLKTRCNRKAPPELQHVEIILKVLPVNDPDFARGNVDNISKKTDILLDLFAGVVIKVRPFVISAYKVWLAEQTEKFAWWMHWVNTSLTNLRMDQDTYAGGHAVVSSGVGGVNVGVYNGLSAQDTGKLQELEKALRRL